MILDRLERTERHRAVHPLFDAAFAALRDPAHRALPQGRHELQPGLALIVDVGTTQAAERRRFESHRRWIDIQLVIQGPEAMLWAPIEALAADGGYDAERDLAFHRDPAGAATRLVVAPECFAIFFPEDGHKPCCHPDGTPLPFRKLVMKVALQP